MNTTAQRRAVSDLREALREIHMAAGLEETASNPYSSPICLGVTSPNRGDGKTTMAMALASSLTNDFGVDVMLVDADLHSHSVAREYGLENEAGLTDVIAGNTNLDSVRHYIPSAKMSVITAGRVSGDPSGIARSDRLAELLDLVKNSTQYVVLDLPATLNSMTAPILARRTDGVVVVVRAGKTSQADLDRTLYLLRDVRVLGVVINRSTTRVPGWVERALNLRP